MKSITGTNNQSLLIRMKRIILGAALLLSVVPVPFAEVVIPGLAFSQLDAELKGLVLIE